MWVLECLLEGGGAARGKGAVSGSGRLRTWGWRLDLDLLLYSPPMIQIKYRVAAVLHDDVAVPAAAVCHLRLPFCGIGGQGFQN